MIIFHNTFISVRKHVANPYPLYSCHHHDISEMLLKVELNTKTLQPLYLCQVTIEMLKISMKCKLHVYMCDVDMLKGVVPKLNVYICVVIFGSCYFCIVPKLNVYIRVVILGSCEVEGCTVPKFNVYISNDRRHSSVGETQTYCKYSIFVPQSLFIKGIKFYPYSQTCFSDHLY